MISIDKKNPIFSNSKLKPISTSLTVNPISGFPGKVIHRVSTAVIIVMIMILMVVTTAVVVVVKVVAAPHFLVLN